MTGRTWTHDAWTAVAGEVGAPPVDVVGPHDALPSVLATLPVAVATVSTALAAGAALAGQRSGRVPTVQLDRAHVADAVRSERAFRVDRRAAGASFAPLSRFWPAADGWVRTHANYPWHRSALLRALGLSETADVTEVGAALAGVPADELQERVVAEGGVAAAVRSPQEWGSSAQGTAVAREPLVALETVGDAAPRPRAATGLPATGLPAGGLRVLDLTRVIAGPVCTRMLGALGADVLRLDPPDHDDIPPGTYADTLLGKRSAVLDAARDADGLHALLDGADVLVCGYRPGSLDRFGLDDAELAHRHPGLVVVRLAAWGNTGPWHRRRGFDSVVQAATGIAAAEGVDGVPGALPCQLLDHGTGYLAAAAALDGVGRQSRDGGTIVRRLSLARTALWLLTGPTGPADPAPITSRTDRPNPYRTVRLGRVDVVPPPGLLDGQPLRWPGPPARFLTDRPQWRD